MLWSKIVVRLRKPLILRRVVGHSMSPTLRPGQIIMASSLLLPSKGRIIIANKNGKEIIKRVKFIEHNTLSLEGDNKHSSHNASLPYDAFIATKLF